MTARAPVGALLSVSPSLRHNEALYNTYTLGGQRSPGVVTFSGHENATGWDVKQAKGNDGASTTRKGHEVKEFTASHYLVDDPTDGGGDEIAAWTTFAALIESTVSGAKPKALDIYHPDLAELGIKSVVKSKIGGRTYDKKGGCTVVVTYLPYFPPKPKPATGPNGSSTKPWFSAGSTGNHGESPGDIALQELKSGFGPK